MRVWAVVEDLGLEVSSARHAAPLMIFEIMRSFFVGFKCSSRSLTFWIWGACSSHSQSSLRMFHADSHFIFLDSVKAILVHCAHRLLSESTLILCTGTGPVRGRIWRRACHFHGRFLRSHGFLMQNGAIVCNAVRMPIDLNPVTSTSPQTTLSVKICRCVGLPD